MQARSNRKESSQPRSNDDDGIDSVKGYGRLYSLLAAGALIRGLLPSKQDTCWKLGIEERNLPFLFQYHFSAPAPAFPFPCNVIRQDVLEGGGLQELIYTRHCMILLLQGFFVAPPHGGFPLFCVKRRDYLEPSLLCSNYAWTWLGRGW